MIRKHTSLPRRSGIILLVVMSLLALFAALGLTFVYYADAASAQASYSKAAETALKADVDPEMLLTFFLSQLIYGPADPYLPAAGPQASQDPVNSTLRGYDLARNMFGYNPLAPNPSIYPYNGVGRAGTTPFTVPAGAFPLGAPPAGAFTVPPPNMTYYPADNVLFDPERNSARLSQAAPPGTYVGWNVPYTYPDLNNLFLAAMNSYGEILAPSWWRYWDAFGGMDPSLNIANLTGTAAYLKYLTMRPHQSVHPYFPLPQDGGGDVKNVESGPGLRNPTAAGKYYANDSIWMDLGFPILIGPDGRKYKPLFASLITDLDNKINLNAHGNILGTGNVNASNMGFGAWEINPAQLLTGGDYQNIFLGNGSLVGRYGSSGVPGLAGASASNSIQALFGALPTSKAPGFQLGFDLNGILDNGSFTLSSKYLLPGENTNGNPAYFGFVNYPAPSGYSTYGSSASAPAELLGHPSLFNVFSPNYSGSTNNAFADSNIEALYRYGGTGSPALTSRMFRLSPASLANPQIQRMLTTRSFDLGMPGAMPWLTAATGPAGYVMLSIPPTQNMAVVATPGTGSLAVGTYYYKITAIIAGRETAASNEQSAMITAPNSQTVTLNWNPVNYATGYNVYRSTTSGVYTSVFNTPVAFATYTDDGSGTLVPGTLPNPAPYPTGPTVPYTPAPGVPSEFGPGVNYNWNLLRRINLNRPLTDYPTPDATTGQILNLAVYQQALTDRQMLAQDIFNVFVQVTMGIPPAPNQPPLAGVDMNAAQWLAQLAVNIVDYRDTDNYSTPFNWNPADPVNGWVFGTELPRVVVNEVYAEIVNNPGDKGPNASLPYYLNSWVELVNTINADPNIVDVLSGQKGAVRLQMLGNYPTYQLVMRQNSSVAGPLGTPSVAMAANMMTMNNYTNTAASDPQAMGYDSTKDPQLVLPATNYFGPNPGNQGFYVVGPATAFPGPGAAVTATLQSANMTFQNVPATAAPQLTIDCYLQRLACPDLPPQTQPNPAMWPNNQQYYNPYITVDYVSKVPVNNGLQFDTVGNPGPPAQNRYSFGKKQPYAGALTAPASGVVPPPNPPFPYQVVPQQPNIAYTAQPQNTFFRQNAVDMSAANTPAAPSATTPNQTLTQPFNWLVHPDRQVSSSVELLHVSQYPPYLLTQQFMGAAPPSPSYFGHISMAAWFDSSARLFRAMEFFESGIRGTSVDVYGNPVLLSGRIPGKININTVWDPQILLTLADPQNLSNFTPADVAQIHNLIMSSRSPGSAAWPAPSGIPGSTDRPFFGMTGNAVTGASVDDTFFRGNPLGQTSPIVSPAGSRLFSVIPNVSSSGTVVYNSPTKSTATLNMGATTPDSSYLSDGAPPFVKMELLSKIYNNITTRSNVFAVWVTVGFFDVTDGPLSDPTLVTTANPGGTVSCTNIVAGPSQSYTVTPSIMNGTILGVPWKITQGCCLWIGNGANLQTVIVTAVNSPAGTFTITSSTPPAVGASIAMRGVLGQEVGISEGRNTRHRMFAVVDRSVLSIPNSLTPTQAAISGQSASATPVPPVPLPQAQVGIAYNQTIAGLPAGTITYTTSPYCPGSAGLSINPNSAASTVTIKGTPNTSGYVAFQVTVTDSMGNMTTSYYTIAIAVEVHVLQVAGVSNLNYPAQSTGPVGPALNVNYPWQFQPGMMLVVDPGGAPETIVVQQVNQTSANTITAIFVNNHASGAMLILPGQPGAVPGSIMGNPGPQQRFDHRLNTALVPHYSIIK